MSEKLHVLWTPSWYPTAQSPLNGSFFLEQINMLRAAHMDVGVLNVSTQPGRQWRPHEPELDASEWTIRESAPSIPFGLAPFERYSLSFAAIRAARLYADNYGVPDVIHAHSTFPGTVTARALAKYWNIPYGVTEHRPSVLNLPRLRPRNSLRRRVLKDADFRLAVSNVFARQLEDAYGCEFGTVTNPVPDHFFTAKRKPHDHFTFIHISNLERLKRAEEVVDAFALIQADHPHTRLKIVGGTPDTLAAVKTHVQRRGLTHLLTMTGPVPRSQIADALADTDCLVLVSQTESAGVVFAEAQSMGIPCIASNTPGGSYMVTADSGIVVPIDDSVALIDAMRRMVTDANDSYPAQKLRKQAWERFGSKKFVQDHRQIYEAAIRAHKR
ncbi:MAG: glycosyltransferase [Actinomycetaceae bacterium]|nr:glycosyltransferase [Actinomycetaceae bacterium]